MALEVGGADDPRRTVGRALRVRRREAVEADDVGAAFRQPPGGGGAHDPASDHRHSHPNYSGAMRAIACPGLTGSPTSSNSSATVPARGEGISALTLSVCASISVSPSATRSPRCLLHAPTVISSAPWRSGITTSRTPVLTDLLSRLCPQSARTGSGTGASAS